MRYALRKQDKIASVYSESYLKDHIIKSLNNYFSVTDDYEITGQIETGETYTCNGSEIEYPVLIINDVSDVDSMLEFAIVGQQYDVLKLSFLGRMKG